MKRLLTALAIATAIYATALGAGSILYATGAIATGATHNDCADFKHQIATERGIDQQDVPQSDIKAATAACLDTHELTAGDAFRTEYLFWSLWPAVITAAVFLAWPAWSRILHRQEQADLAAEASRLDLGQ